MADLYIPVRRRHVDAFVRHKLAYEIHRLEKLQVTAVEQEVLPKIRVVFEAIEELQELLKLLEALDDDAGYYENRMSMRNAPFKDGHDE